MLRVIVLDTYKMHEEYQDKPEKIGAWVDSLEGRDQTLFDAGYLIAIEGILEEFGKSKRKLLADLLDIDDLERITRIEAKIFLLDAYERAYTERAKLLSRDRALQATCWPVYS